MKLIFFFSFFLFPFLLLSIYIYQNIQKYPKYPSNIYTLNCSSKGTNAFSSPLFPAYHKDAANRTSVFNLMVGSKTKKQSLNWIVDEFSIQYNMGNIARSQKDGSPS